MKGRDYPDLRVVSYLQVGGKLMDEAWVDLFGLFCAWFILVFGVICVIWVIYYDYRWVKEQERKTGEKYRSWM